jgi:hypothetical protein
LYTLVYIAACEKKQNEKHMIIAVKITSNIKNFRISSINNTRALNGGEEKEYKRG